MPPIIFQDANDRENQNGHGCNDSTLSDRHNIRAADVNNGPQLKITASLTDSPRVMRRNTPDASRGSVTVTPKPGDMPTTHTVLRDEDGNLRAVETSQNSRIQRSVKGNRENVLGTIRVAVANDAPESGEKETMKHSQQTESFQIIVHDHKNSDKKKFDVKKTDTVDTLKTLIADRIGTAKEDQKLVFRGKNLIDKDKSLDYYEVEAGSEILLTKHFHGG